MGNGGEKVSWKRVLILAGAVIAFEIRRMDPQEAVLLLMRQTLVPRRQEMAEKLLGMLDELFREVPVYQMQCTISECAAKMAYESMRGEGI